MKNDIDLLLEILKDSKNDDIKLESNPSVIDYDDIFNVKSYSEVCRILGERELHLDKFNFLPIIDAKKALSFARIKQLERLFNQGWTPNWENINEYKYYLWYEFKNKGWVFCRDGGVSGKDFGGEVGFYKSKEIVEHIQKYFEIEYLNIP